MTIDVKQIAKGFVIVWTLESIRDQKIALAQGDQRASGEALGEYYMLLLLQ